MRNEEEELPVNTTSSVKGDTITPLLQRFNSNASSISIRQKEEEGRGDNNNNGVIVMDRRRPQKLRRPRRRCRQWSSFHTSTYHLLFMMIMCCCFFRTMSQVQGGSFLFESSSAHRRHHRRQWVLPSSGDDIMGTTTTMSGRGNGSPACFALSPGCSAGDGGGVGGGKYLHQWGRTKTRTMTTTVSGSPTSVMRTLLSPAGAPSSLLIRNGRYCGGGTTTAVAAVKWPNLLDRDSSSSSSSTTKKKKSGGRGGGKEKLKIDIGDRIGSGSYGTVHFCTFTAREGGGASDGTEKEDGGGDDATTGVTMIAKRAWTEKEITEQREGGGSSNNPAAAAAAAAGDGDDVDDDGNNRQSAEERAKRCRHYLDVERHCFEKIEEDYLQRRSSESGGGDDESGGGDVRRAQVPEYIGSFVDTSNDEHTWLVFKSIERTTLPTPSGQPWEGISRVAVNLADAIHTDWRKQHSQEGEPHHLFVVQRELGLSSETTFGETLDVVLQSLLRALVDLHRLNILHRDVKPANLLCDPQTSSLVLIDFGSAADMDPVTSGGSNLLASMGIGNGGRVGLDGDTVAVSPIYSAPEVFVKWDRSPLNFDVFSAALIICQLLFNLLDDRTDAAFHQQLQDVDHDLDAWLSRALTSTIRPAGLEDAMTYLGERPGMWGLLRDMLRANPERRLSSRDALERVQVILSDIDGDEEAKPPGFLNDGPYFESVLSTEVCVIISDEDDVVASVVENDESTVGGADLKRTPEWVEEEDGGMPPKRPLHFVATFDRKESIGLILSEAELGEDEVSDADEDMDEDAKSLWNLATAGARPGEVFVRGITPLGQADRLDIFEVGDQLSGIGEIPLAGGGFEKAVDMLARQPESAKTVKLHFDRISAFPKKEVDKALPHLARVVDQGAWSSKGRRKAQEDRFVLQEVHDGKGNNLLFAGVFDGHGGTAASSIVADIFPDLIAAKVGALEGKATHPEIRQALVSSWETTCNTYRSGCDEDTLCMADYDPVTGEIMAGTGSEDLVAGTTAVAAVLSVDHDGGEEANILNCGDSRALVIGRPLSSEGGRRIKQSVVHFATRDHSPSDDLEGARLKAGMEAGLGYSLPECSFSRWWLTVGDYQYAVSRSLEGNSATTAGIVSDPDVSPISLTDMLTTRRNAILLLASDGLFDVMDNEEVGRDLIRMRDTGVSASDAAKNLCGLALQKGTSDNVSVVVVYMD